MGEAVRPGPASRWGDLGRRAASAAVLAPVALAAIWWGGAAFGALIVAAGVVLCLEWAALDGAVAAAAWLAVPVLAGLGLSLSGLPAAGLLAVLAGVAAVWLLSRRVLRAGGVLAIGLPLLALLWLRSGAAGRGDTLFLVLLVWASDVGAYVVGRLVGGRKLAPRLSPGKTWSGAAGGLLAAAVTAAALAPERWALALLLGFVCQAGDLLESAIKRHVGVKDTGRLIPGHGGLLDRLDGLMAASVAFALAMLLSRGGWA